MACPPPLRMVWLQASRALPRWMLGIVRRLPLALAIVDGNDCRRLGKTFGEARGDDANNPGMPTLAGKDEALALTVKFRTLFYFGDELFA